MTPESAAPPATNPMRGLAILVVASVVGEGVRQGLCLPVPGAVLGIVGLFAVFAWRGGVPVDVGGMSGSLLRYLPLFFVPPGVGVMDDARLVGSTWPTVAAALAGSTVLCLLVTAAVLASLNRLLRKVRPAG